MRDDQDVSLTIYLIGGTAVDESRLLDATAAAHAVVRVRVLDASLAPIDALNGETDPRLEQLVIVDMSLDDWEAIVTALQTKAYSGVRAVAVLVGEAEMWRLCDVWRLHVRGFQLRPIRADQVVLLASHLRLAWPRQRMRIL